MVNINEAFPSNYLKAADLGGNVVRVTINTVTYEKVGSDDKLIVYFQGKQKGLPLNKTNGMTIAAALGPETDGWYGADIELFSQRVPFQGQQVDAIRVRVPQQRSGPQQTQQQVPNMQANARQHAAAPQSSDDRQAPTGDPGYDAGYEDEIPF